MIEEKFLTKPKFSKMVEDCVHDNDIPYLDAILMVCEKNGIEPEDTKKFLSKQIKDILETEAQELNYIQKTPKLPI